MRWIACLLLVLASGSSLAQKPPNRSVLPLSPLFARLAYLMQQEFSDWSRMSDTPPNPDDVFSESPFSILEKAIDDEMDRVQEFDVRTRGDQKLFDMLLVAQSFILTEHTSGMYQQGSFEERHPHLACLSSIRQTISRRAWTGDGACVVRDDKQIQAD